MQQPEEEGSGGDGGGGGLTWQQNTQIVELSFEAYRHGRSRAHAELNLPYLQLHTMPVCRLLFGSLLQKKTHKDCRSHRRRVIINPETCGVLCASFVSVQSVGWVIQWTFPLESEVCVLFMTKSQEWFVSDTLLFFSHVILCSTVQQPRPGPCHWSVWCTLSSVTQCW